MELLLKSHDVAAADQPYLDWLHCQLTGVHPNNPSQTLVKRIVAEPGDRVAFRDGLVLRNGVALDETFIPIGRRSHEDRVPVLVPQGYYFVLGDHRSNSLDSRALGPVPEKYILGRVQLRWWPLATARVYEP